jgi:hypothetical protein
MFMAFWKRPYLQLGTRRAFIAVVRNEEKRTYERVEPKDQIMKNDTHGKET